MNIVKYETEFSVGIAPYNKREAVYKDGKWIDTVPKQIKDILSQGQTLLFNVYLRIELEKRYRISEENQNKKEDGNAPRLGAGKKTLRKRKNMKWMNTEIKNTDIPKSLQ